MFCVPIFLMNGNTLAKINIISETSKLFREYFRFLFGVSFTTNTQKVYRFPFAHPPLFLRTKVGEALIPHRLWNGLATDLERRYNGGKYRTQENCNVEIAFPISKNRIFKLLCNSSPIALQVIVTLIVTAVIHFNTLVTHSSPRHRILY